MNAALETVCTAIRPTEGFQKLTVEELSQLGALKDKHEKSNVAGAKSDPMLDAIQEEFRHAMDELSGELSWRDGRHAPKAMKRAPFSPLDYLPSSIRSSVSEIKHLGAKGVRLRFGLERLDRSITKGEALEPLRRYVTMTQTVSEIEKCLAYLAVMLSGQPDDAKIADADIEYVCMNVDKVDLLGRRSETAIKDHLIQQGIVHLSNETSRLRIIVPVAADTLDNPDWEREIQFGPDEKFDDATAQRVVVAACRYALLRGRKEEVSQHPEIDDALVITVTSKSPADVIPKRPFCGDPGEPVWVRMNDVVKSRIR